MPSQFESLSVAIAPIFGFFGRVGTNVWYSVSLLVTVVVYICLGALAFQKFETGEKFMNLTAEHMDRVDMLKFFTIDESYNGKALTEADWAKIHTLSKGRCFKADAKGARTNIWNFWSSMDFASTILTTIGYGGMVPHTTMGKYVVLLYGVPGMLLMMSYLNLFSVLILLVIKKILVIIESLANFTRTCLKRLRGRPCGRGKRLSSFSISVVLAVTSLLMLIAYLVLMSMILASSSPNDNFLKALYFYVITMTTVGLGDIAVIDHQWYGVSIKVLIVFCIGLALVTTVFGAMRGLAEANRKRVVKATKLLAEKAKAQKNKIAGKLRHDAHDQGYNENLIEENDV